MTQPSPNRETSYESPVLIVPAESKKSSRVLTLDYVYGGDIVGEDLSHKKIEFHVNEGHVQVYDSNGEKIGLGALSRGERVIVAYLDSTGPSIPTATTVFRLPADYQTSWGSEIEASHSAGDGAGRLSLADGGVEITLPPTWTVEPPKGSQSASGKPILVARGTHFTSREQPSLYVYTQKTTLASLEELNSRVRRFLVDDKEAMIQAESDVGVAGLPGHVIHFQGNLGDQSFHHDLVSVLKGDKVVLFLFAARPRPDDYGAFVEQFRLILGTLSVQLASVRTLDLRLSDVNYSSPRIDAHPCMEGLVDLLREFLGHRLDRTGRSSKRIGRC